jgi:hypothetical protein
LEISDELDTLARTRSGVASFDVETGVTRNAIDRVKILADNTARNGKRRLKLRNKD